MTTSSGLSSLLWFVAIIALIPVAIWLLKRSPIAGNASHGLMRSIAALPLGAQQRIVTVEVGQGDERRWLVLGVTAHSITTLHTMAPQADSSPGGATPASLSFAQLLGKFGRNGGGAPDGR